MKMSSGLLEAVKLLTLPAELSQRFPENDDDDAFDPRFCGSRTTPHGAG